MAKIPLSGSAVTNAGIAADPTRVALEFEVGEGGQDVEFSPEATFNPNNCARLRAGKDGVPGDKRTYEGALAQRAFSFGIAANTQIQSLTY